MTKELLVPFTLSLPKEYRDLLRRMAAEDNLAHPDGMTTSAGLAREIICKHLSQIDCESEEQSVQSQTKEKTQ